MRYRGGDGGAMVLPEVRAELRGALSALIDGRLPNDGFDEVYYRLCVGSPDRAVEVIGGFGWGLYHDMERYYLTGWNAVSAETRAMAERCDLFLRSDLEYEWPLYSAPGWVWFAKMVAVASVSLVLLLAAVLVVPALLNSAWGGAGVIVLIAVLAAVPWLWGFRWLSRYEERQGSAFWSCGPREAWPFFSEVALQQACSRAAEEVAAADGPRE